MSARCALLVGFAVAASGLGCGLSDTSSGAGGGPSSSSSTSGASAGSGGGGTQCTDGIRNGDETDVDCGGSCAACAFGQACKTAGDCWFDCQQEKCVAPLAPRWSVAPANGPPLRAFVATAYDSTLGVTLLFGGSDPNNNLLNELWAYDGQNWTNISPTSGSTPGGRIFPGMAYDEARHQTVVFGGADNSGNVHSSDTWLFTAGAWTQPMPTPSPLARGRAAMAYDPVRKVTVLFGGLADGGQFQGDTWEFDGTSWVDRTPGPPPLSPSARIDAAMAYDAARGRMLVFGGLSPSPPVNGDTWAWDGAAWTALVPANSPPPRFAAGVAADSRRKRIVMHGGNDGSGIRDDTWEWDGTNWEASLNAMPGPVATYWNPLAFDAKRGKIVHYVSWTLVSFVQETWEYDVLGWPCATAHDCGSGFCRDGLCCDAACDETCRACDTREAPGHCAKVLSKADPDSCDKALTCDAGGNCVPAP